MSEPNKIVGSVIVYGKVRPFVFHTETGVLGFDVYEPQSPQTQTEFDKEEIEIRVSHQSPFLFDEIRLGEYFCESCKSWFAANKNQWSFGICLYCSLDRGTELSEMFDE